jgi:predicted ATPase/DNA-binding SARP family transcriptional activator
MRFGILGPFVVADDQGREVALGGRKQRSVLAILVLHVGEVVSSDRLIEELWGDRAPSSAAKTIQVYVSKLRKALSDPVVITRGGGYALDIGHAAVDAHRFEVLLADGCGALEAGDTRVAATVLREALGLWRGPALSDFAFDPFAQDEIARLEDLRMRAVMARIDADLALGSGSELTGEIETMIAADPFQERLRGQLMIALYRAGRRSDALAVYREVSRLLRDELGLEPSTRLRELELSILRQDPSLDRVGHLARARPGNLPVAATPFVGRARELAEVSALLQSPGTRLLTLTGAGGSGKTRLALRVAEDSLDQYRDGVMFVGFADVTDPDLIASTICRQFDLADQPGVEPAARLEAWLVERELLLVLDNLEHLAAGSGLLGELLAGCAGLVLLVTSREPLHLAGEQQYDVPVLALADAVELFATRAHAIAPRLSVPANLAGRICKRLDCLPLAIELAAARAKALSPEGIFARLDRRLPLLTGGPRDAPQRQRTLKATIDWSYDLLNDEERRLFSRLAAFAGGCTLPAAESVCGADLDSLYALVDRSLVRSDGVRYWQLQTVREYALDRLRTSGEYDAVYEAHGRWLIELLDLEGLAPPGWPHEQSHSDVLVERENFRGALEWASALGRFDTVARLAAPLVGVWVVTGELHEASRWMPLVLAHRDEYSERLTAQVLSAARALARHKGEYADAGLFGEQALAAWRDLGAHDGIANELVSLGTIAVLKGDSAGGRAVLEEAIRYVRDYALADFLPRALNNLGDLALFEGELAEARLLCEECAAVTTPASLPADVALINLSHIASLEGRHAEATSLASDALRAALRRGDRLTAAWAAIEMAWPLAERGELRSSAMLLGAGLAFLEAAGADREWTDTACEEAVRKILNATLNPATVEELLHEGRNLPFEQLAHSPLGARGGEAR